MDITQSITVLKTLASGTNPATGELYAEDSPYNAPEVIRALYACIQHLEHPPRKSRMTLEERQADNLKRGLPRNAGLPWTPELKADLSGAFETAKSSKDLARQFERTPGSILAELQKQGLITEAQARSF